MDNIRQLKENYLYLIIIKNGQKSLKNNQKRRKKNKINSKIKRNSIYKKLKNKQDKE